MIPTDPAMENKLATEPIEYKEGFKYQLTKPHTFYLPIQPGGWGDGAKYKNCGPFITVYRDGRVDLAVGYSWDGASGPTIDDETNQVPGLEHDASYQLMINDILSRDPFRKLVDIQFRDGCLARGMNWFRAQYFYLGVRKGGQSAATDKRKVCTAP